MWRANSVKHRAVGKDWGQEEKGTTEDEMLNVWDMPIVLMLRRKSKAKSEWVRILFQVGGVKAPKKQAHSNRARAGRWPADSKANIQRPIRVLNKGEHHTPCTSHTLLMHPLPRTGSRNRESRRQRQTLTMIGTQVSHCHGQLLVHIKQDQPVSYKVKEEC